MKTCTSCKQTLSLSEFSIRNDTKKPRSWCKKCASKISIQAQRNKRMENPTEFRAHKAAIARRKVLRKFNLSEQDLEDMGDIQNWDCAICGSIIIDKPYIDHDHSTGKVRELLCLHCNVGLGHFRDSIAILEKAVKYLEKHSV